jgi:hypothetical protein
LQGFVPTGARNLSWRIHPSCGLRISSSVGLTFDAKISAALDVA